MARNETVQRALDYPYSIPDTSYFLTGSGALEVRDLNVRSPSESAIKVGGEVVALAEALSSCDAPFRDAPLIPVLASGSNASPAQLHRKFASLISGYWLLGLICEVTDVASVYSAHFTSYGAIAATLAPQAGATSGLVCLMLPEPLLEVLHGTESLGMNYGYYQLPELVVKLAGGQSIEAPYGYVSLRGALDIGSGPIRLPSFHYTGPPLTVMDERAVIEAVRRRAGWTQSVEELVEGAVTSLKKREALNAVLAGMSTSVLFSGGRRIV